jgi:hypothetical protein
MTIDAQQSGEENIFVRGDANYTKVGGGEHCIEEGCMCIEFIPKEDNAEICNTCGHTILKHNKTERLKSNFKKIASSIVDQKNEKTRQKNKLEFLLQLYKNKFEEFGDLEAFQFFKIPFALAERWRPMLIKSFSQYERYYSESNPDNSMKYKDMRKFNISAHGSTSIMKTNIDLLPNEIVIMSCHILESVTSCRMRDLISEFISPSNNDLIHIDNIRYLMNTKESSNRKDAISYMYEKETKYGDRNNYCIYTNRCPNLQLDFYDYGSTFRENLPFFIYESPIRYSSATIRDFLLSLKLDDRLNTTSQEILDLPLNADTDLYSPNMLKYLFNDITYSTTNNNDDKPTKSQLVEYIPRISTLVNKLGNQEDKPINSRAVQTFYKHINFTKKRKSTLLDEIGHMRNYWKSLPEKKWENNPKKYVIYFVYACR